MTTTAIPALTATYTDEGEITIAGTWADGSAYFDRAGTYDANGGEWQQPVAELLARAGYVLAGAWDAEAGTVRVTRR